MEKYNHKEIKTYSIEQLEEFISSGKVPPGSGAFDRIREELNIRYKRVSREEDKKIDKIALWTLIAAIVAAVVGVISLLIQVFLK